MSKKSKGSNAERELVAMFWKTVEWSCMRAAGSGSTPHPCPDIIAGNILRKLAIECKATKEQRKYFTAEEIGELQQFSQKFGAEPWVGIRFDYEKWYFLSLDDLKQSRKGFSTTLIEAKRKGLLFEELIGKFRQERLT